MVDVVGQYARIKDEVDGRINKVIQSGYFIGGPEVAEFSEKLSHYLGVKHVIPCGNGTDALQIALMALDLSPGDEVIVPNFTFIASVEVIALLGLKPVLVDVDLEDFNISLDQIRNALTARTKAIMPVHLFGQVCHMDEITKLAQEKNLFVIEDNAQAIGADYLSINGVKKKSGTLGDIGCTSFYPSKNLGCYGDGGAIVTDDDDLAHKIRQIANHGMTRRYYHDRIGVNSRLDAMQAAVLNVKIGRLDTYNAARQSAAKYYDNKFKNIIGLITPKRNSDSSHVFHQYTLRILDGKRDELKDYLEERNIPAMIYYPVPLHKQKAFESYLDGKNYFQISMQLSEEVLSLPMHTELTEEVLEYISETIVSFFD